MSGDTGRQSSSEVAHEAEDTRAHLASTLEQLRMNLKPENVMEEVVSNARIGASTVADSVVEVVKAYPFPSLLIAAGAAMIMGLFTRSVTRKPDGELKRELARGNRFPTDRGSVRFRPAPGRAGSNSSMSDPSRLSAAVTPSASEVRGSTSSAAARTPGLGNAPKRQSPLSYSSTSSNTRDAMQSVSRYIPSDSGEIKSKLSRLLDEQPLVLGAIGIAVGAAIGAALPMTETEESLMGTTAHSVRQAAQDVARHEVDGLRSAAGQVVENVKQSAVDHGLSTDNLNDLVKDVGAHARTAVNQVGASYDPNKKADG